MFRRLFRRAKFNVLDDLVLDNILTYLPSHKYLRVSRRYRLIALSKYPNRERLFKLIVSSEIDRDDVLDGIEETYSLPVTLSVRYWKRYGPTARPYLYYKNLEVKYLSIAHMVDSGIYDRCRDSVLNIIIYYGWSDLFKKMVTEEDLDRVLTNVIYSQSIHPRDYLELIKNREHIRILQDIAYQRCNYDDDISLMKYIEYYRPDLL